MISPFYSSIILPILLEQNRVNDDDDDSITMTSSSPVIIPEDHFLNRNKIETSSRSDKNWSETARPDINSLAAADYDVNIYSGFLPPEEPIQRLNQQIGGGWSNLEDALEAVQLEIKLLGIAAVGRVSNTWRNHIKEMALPDTTVLVDLPLLRRAHVLLSFLGHAHIHSDFPTLSTVPAPIAVPWIQVSDRLGLPPVLTYADTVLWNWKLVDKTLGIIPSNLAINTTFTSTPSELAFFRLSLLCEVNAPALLRSMSSILDESFFADSVAFPRVARHLTDMATLIDCLAGLLAMAMKNSYGEVTEETILPECFYWQIRPWFNGGKWTFEGVESSSNKEMNWQGPSAGQSSIIHAVDCFLGVDHTPRRPPTASTSSTSSTDDTNKRPTDETYMIRATQYMPKHHRAFLLHLSSLSSPSSVHPHPLPSTRSLAQSHPAALGSAYDTAVLSMKRFRDEHMKIAARFIVSQARSEPGLHSVFHSEWDKARIQKEEEAKSLVVVDADHKGTGGTSLVSFLKECRTRTTQALLN